MKWISTENGLPDYGEIVLVKTEYLNKGKPASEIFVGYRNESEELYQLPDDDSYGWDFAECVTYWMPIEELENILP